MIPTRQRENPGGVGSALPRLTPLVPVLALLAAGSRVTALYWVLAVVAALVFAAGGRRPLPMSLLVSALTIPMFGTHVWSPADFAPYLLGAVALLDAATALRHRGSLIAAGAWTVAAVLGALLHGHTAVGWRETAVFILATVGLPLLAGWYQRAQRELAESYRQRLAAAEGRRAEAELRARTVERSALARELHDIVAHHMAAIVVRTAGARRLPDTDARVATVLDDVHDTAAEALRDIRSLLAALHETPDYAVAFLEPGAVAAEIDAVVERVRAAGFSVQAWLNAEPDELDAIGRLTLVRLLQESLTNVLKHADPTAPVTVRIAALADAVSVQVTSQSARSRTDPPEPGYGLVGMRERTRLAGGTLTVGPTASGWEVDARLPVRGPDPEAGR